MSGGGSNILRTGTITDWRPEGNGTGHVTLDAKHELSPGLVRVFFHQLRVAMNGHATIVQGQRVSLFVSEIGEYGPNAIAVTLDDNA